MRDIEKKIKRGQRPDLGKHDREIPLNSDVRSNLKIEKEKITQEKDMPDSLEYNELIMILVGRSKAFREKRENPNLMETMKK